MKEYPQPAAEEVKQLHKSAPEKETITAYVPEEISSDIETLADEYDLNKSAMISYLLDEALAGERWREKKRRAEQLMNDEDTTGFVTTAVDAEGRTVSEGVVRVPGVSDVDQDIAQDLERLNPELNGRRQLGWMHMLAGLLIMTAQQMEINPSALMEQLEVDADGFDQVEDVPPATAFWLMLRVIIEEKDATTVVQ